MRLLQVQSQKFVEYPNVHEAPGFGILSHRWQSQEVSYQDMISGNARNKTGFLKLQEFCRHCAVDGLSLAWIDTCCINKDSSAELSEAINSMYRWYQSASKCYVLLTDVSASARVEHMEDGRFTFADSEWFRRGWTLQELIAPSTVHFYDRDWHLMGTKEQLSIEISEITRIPINVLHGEDQRNYCVAQRMSWAAGRKTTRIEDRAYSLMGLFNVNMPMLYGEGEKAFIRLQEEIIRYSADQSIFAWPGIISSYDKAEMYDLTSRRLEGLLATSPDAFALCGNIRWMPGTKAQVPFSLTNLGLSMKLTLRQCSMDVYEAKLNCWLESKEFPEPIAIFLRQTDQDGQFVRHEYDGSLTDVWKESRTEQRDVQINVVQGQQTSFQPCRHMVMLFKTPLLDCASHICMPDSSRHTSTTTFISLGDYGTSIVLVATAAGLHGSYTMSLDFRFDFHFNPYLQVAFDAGKVRPQRGIQYAVSPDSSAESRWDSVVHRSMLVEQSSEKDGDRWVFSGHRSQGLLVWMCQTNLLINVQRKDFLQEMVWTIEILKALPGRRQFVSYESCVAPISKSGARSISNLFFTKHLSPSLRSRNTEVVGVDDQCPICKGLLAAPILTGCGHVFCQTCIRWADLSFASTNLASITLDSKGHHKPILCPLCHNATSAALDSIHQQHIQTMYPITYRLSSLCSVGGQKDTFPLFENLTLFVGNTHKLTHLSASATNLRNRHDWTFFVRPSKPEFIANVRFVLHPTYRESHVTLTSPPFEIRRFGWGTFCIKAEITLRSGYKLLHENAHSYDRRRSTLGLEWWLNFDGDGGQGWLRVMVERTKHTFSENDLKLRDQIARLRELQAHFQPNEM